MEEEIVLHLPDDIHKLCRTCMSVTSNILSHDILLVDANQVTLAGEMLQSCFAVELQSDEGLPKSICDECANKLEMVYNFKNQCTQTEAGLRNLLNFSEHNDEVTKCNTNILKYNENKAKEFDSNNCKGVVLFESNLQKNFVEDTSEDKTGNYINFNAIFLQNKSTSNYANLELSSQKEENLNRRLQYDLLELIEERKTINKTKLDNSRDYDDIDLLIQERKEASNLDDNIIKEELFSENEDSTNIFCTFCENYFETNKDFENHYDACKDEAVVSNILKLENSEDTVEQQNLKTNNRPKFECHICSREFLTRHSRKLHMNSHNLVQSSKMHTCDLCDKKFPSESNLISHFYKHVVHIRKELQVLNYESGEFNIELEDVSESLICNVCQKKFTCCEKLNEHLDEHKKAETKCNFCSKEFIGEVLLVKHLKRHGSNIVICKVCLKRFDNSFKLKEHERSHPLETRESIIVTCPICKSKFTNLIRLKNHSVTHVNDSYHCERCKRNFNNKIVYENHMQQHAAPRFLCSLCGKQYFSSATLGSHLRSHNNEKPFQCVQCKKHFVSRATLSVHKRIHSEFKPFICPHCGYRCRQSGDLVMHIRTHTGVKPYLCKFPNCDRRFTTSSQRMEHHRRHTNERNHKCKLCNKAFLESKTLKVHMMTHTGEKPHECHVCGRRFRRTHHLSNHMKGHKDLVASKLD